jgi:ABC-type polysaccharide/polyol phosphate export permease
MFRTEVQVGLHGTAMRPSAPQLLRDGIDDVASRRRLIRYLVAADMKKRGSDTILGNLWWILDPLLQMVVYIVFVTIITRRPTPDFPLFIFCALLPWKWFSAVITDATSSVVRQDKLIRQIAFPKLVLPIASASAGVVGFAWGLIPLVGLLLFYPERWSPLVLLFPVIAVVQYVFSVASAIVVSAANVFFRDLGNVIGHLLRLWWFMSPGLYTQQLDITFVQDNRWVVTLFSLNPFAVLFEAYRAITYGSPDGPPFIPSVVPLLVLLVGSLVLLALGTIFFKRVEPDFAKVL